MINAERERILSDLVRDRQVLSEVARGLGEEHLLLLGLAAVGDRPATNRSRGRFRKELHPQSREHRRRYNRALRKLINPS